MTRDDEKRAAALAAMAFVQRGQTIGVGTGSTADFFIAGLAANPGLVVAAVPSSEASAAALRAAGIPVLDPTEAPLRLPLYVDGADEVDPELRLIKGRGGAHTREKTLATAAELFVCIVDETKLVARLGVAPLPLEVVPWSAPFVAQQVAAMGGRPAARPGFLTDNGNLVLDVTALDLTDATAAELELDAIPGVVECGLFARRRADAVLVAGPDGVRTLRRLPA